MSLIMFDRRGRRRWPPLGTQMPTAQAGEAQRAETVKQGSVHEHAVPKGCAQNKSA